MFCSFEAYSWFKIKHRIMFFEYYTFLKSWVKFIEWKFIFLMQSKRKIDVWFDYSKLFRLITYSIYYVEPEYQYLIIRFWNFFICTHLLRGFLTFKSYSYFHVNLKYSNTCFLMFLLCYIVWLISDKSNCSLVISWHH